MHKFFLVRLDKYRLFPLALALNCRWREKWRSWLWWSLSWIFHCALALFGTASSIFRDGFFLLDLLLGAFSLPQISLCNFDCVCLLFKLFVKNSFDCSFGSNFFPRIVLVLLKCLMESLVISSRLDIVQES